MVEEIIIDLILRILLIGYMFSSVVISFSNII